MLEADAPRGAATSKSFYRPFAFPPHALLRSHPLRCAATAVIEQALRSSRTGSGGGGVYLPVAHTLSTPDGVKACEPTSSDPHFYYLAPGCSDLHVHAANDTMVVARNRADAVVQLLMRKFGLTHAYALEKLDAEMRGHSGGKAVSVCGLDGLGLLKVWTRLDACAMAHRERQGQLDQADVHQALCVHRSRAFMGLMNVMLLALLSELRMSTAVLLHEAPGGPSTHDQTSFPWKTELVRNKRYTQDAFFSYAASSSPAASLHRVSGAPKRCEVGDRDKCLYCTAPADAQTPLAKRACLGDRSG